MDVEEDSAETEPSDEHLRGVLQQNVCGEDAPPLCESERIRERNEAMRETLED